MRLNLVVMNLNKSQRKFLKNKCRSGDLFLLFYFSSITIILTQDPSDFIYASQYFF